MTDTAELAAAIASVKRATPETAPWSASDFSDAENPPEIDRHIATILNAVVSGDLAEVERLRAHIDNLRTTWSLGDLQASDFENALQRKEGNG